MQAEINGLYILMPFIFLKKGTASYKYKKKSRPNNVKAPGKQYPKQK